MILRDASTEDAAAIAAVFWPARRLLKFLPDLHTIAEDRCFIEHVVLKECAVTVAQADGRIVAFLGRHGDEIRHLYSTHPDWLGRGAGSLLIERAKAAGMPALELWCFQANARARRLYETRGFRAIRFTDGLDNEEKAPDVRYRWEPDDSIRRRGGRDLR